MTNEAETQTIQNSHPNRGEVIAVCSAKGGIGRTILTVNLAVALQKKNISVAIMDGDFQFGDVGLALDLQNSFTIKDAVDGLAKLDENSFQEYLSEHSSGVQVLPAPERPEFADLLSKEAVNKIINLLRAKHEYVVIDTEAGLNEHTINIIEQADQILVVTNLEMTALKNTKLLLETLGILDLQSKAKVIINRANMDSILKAEDAAKILGSDDPIYIPNDFHICSQSLNIGIPFVINQGKTGVAKGVFKMAETLSGPLKIDKKHSKKNHFHLSKCCLKRRRKGGKD